MRAPGARGAGARVGRFALRRGPLILINERSGNLSEVNCAASYGCSCTLVLLNGILEVRLHVVPIASNFTTVGQSVVEALLRATKKVSNRLWVLKVKALNLLSFGILPTDEIPSPL